MAEKKVVKVEETKKTSTSKGLNIDTTELKKIGVAIVSFVASNPELVSKLLEKPANYLKKIVNGEDVSSSTKKTVNKTIDDNKSGGLASILTSLSGLTNDNSTSSVFSDLSKNLTGGTSGVDLSSVLSGVGSLLGSTSSKKTTKKSSSDDNVLGSIIKGLFK